MKTSGLAVALGLALLASTSASAQEAVATSDKVTGVVELFTSQGCSSCPPADRLLSGLAREPGVLALAYHVDYWDYIGWKDTFGTRENTERQRAYASAFGTGAIYTPQIVVNGRREMVGSRVGEVRRALAETSLRADGEAAADVRLWATDDRLHITASIGDPPPGAGKPALMLITYENESEVAIARGENSGISLVNTNAVLDWRIIGMWNGETLEVDIPMATLKPPAGQRSGCAVILQAVTADGKPGPILAAAALDFGTG